MTMIQNHYNNQELPLVAAVFTSLLCIAFGANAVAIKISLSGLGAFTTAGLRFSMATVVIFLWAKFTRRSFGIKEGQLHQLLIVSLFFAVQMSLLYFGLRKTHASRGTLLINLQPFFVLFLAHYLIPGDRMTIKKTLGLFMGFAGMALVFLGKEGITKDIQIGDFAILLGAFVWACNSVYTKRIIHAFEPFQIVLYSLVFSVPFFFVAGFIWDSTMITHLHPKVLISLFYQGLFIASFGFVIWNHLLQKYGAVSLHSFIFIMPITGVVLGGMVLGEPITLNMVLALLLIVLGILVVNLRTRKYAPLFPPRGI